MAQDDPALPGPKDCKLRKEELVSYQFISTAGQEMQYNLLLLGEFRLLIIVWLFLMMVDDLKIVLGLVVEVGYHIHHLMYFFSPSESYVLKSYIYYLLLRFSNAILTLLTLFRSLSFLLWSWSRLVASSMACWSNWSSIIALLFA